MTTFGDRVYQQGGSPVASAAPMTAGDEYFLDPTNGSDDNDGKAIDRAKATLLAAYNLTTANQNDIVHYIAGSSSLTLSAALTWAKNYTHLIGHCAPTMVAQRARIFQLSTLTGASPLLTISATGCIFQNLYIFQGVDDATSLINVSVTGGRNYFWNVHFAGGGHATQAINGGASLKLNGADENTFEDCTIGVDTADAATGMASILMDSEATRNVFRRCNLTMKASNAGAIFVEVADNAGIDRYTIFDECLFINSSATTLTQAFAIPAGMSIPRGPIILKNCLATGADDWDANDRGVIVTTLGTFTAGGNAGLAAATVAA